MKFLRNLKRFINNKPKAISKSHIMKYLHEENDLVILEAGAFNGSDTWGWHKLLPSATIHAFEPLPEPYKILEKRFSNIHNVITYNFGLGPNTGMFKMNVSKNELKVDDLYGESSSILQPKEHLNFHSHIKFIKQIDIDVYTIDDWAKKYNVEKVDFMWLDLQGAEYDVLQSSPKMLATTKVIFSEVSLKEMYEGTPLYEDYKNWLWENGFKVAIEDLRWKDMGNVLFIRH